MPGRAGPAHEGAPPAGASPSYNGPGTAPDWVLHPSDRPRVCVVWGTSTTRMSGPRSFLLPTIIEAVAGLDVEVVVTATAEDLAAAGPLPAGVRGVERCPLHLLLPSCDAVVHHGGAGCLMTALHTGTPQLALSFAIEQQLNGERVATTGAGAHLGGHLATVDSIRAAVSGFIDKPSYRTAAQRLRDSLATRPSPAQLVDVLADLAAKGRC